MKKGVYVLPNGLTLCGMFLGFYSVLASFRGEYTVAAWAILGAGVFDGLDGWVARLTNTTSRFGIQLDSLSDLVAFGVAPSVLFFSWSLKDFGRLGWAAAFLVIACGALRLARFNVQMDTAESKSFTGMPIPSAAGILATTVLFHFDVFDGRPERNILFLLLAFTVAYLMVSTIRYHSAKEINLRQRKPFWILVLFVALFALVTVNPPVVLFLFGMVYMASGVAEYLYLKAKQKKRAKANA